mgnify:CR=1 FL=1|jgi:hypothetical protein
MSSEVKVEGNVPTETGWYWWVPKGSQHPEVVVVSSSAAWHTLMFRRTRTTRLTWSPIRAVSGCWLNRVSRPEGWGDGEIPTSRPVPRSVAFPEEDLFPLFV